MTAGDEFQKRVAEARPGFLRRLAGLQKAFKEFKDSAEFFYEFTEVEADRRLVACGHFNGKFCNAWQRRSRPNAYNRHNYEMADEKYYLKDPGPLCAPCPLYEPKGTK
jgi:hypothetical protein